jgi:hypothetical protein
VAALAIFQTSHRHSPAISAEVLKFLRPREPVPIGAGRSLRRAAPSPTARAGGVRTAIRGACAPVRLCDRSRAACQEPEGGRTAQAGVSSGEKRSSHQPM